MRTTANTAGGTAAGHNGLFQNILSAEDADLVVVNLDAIDDGAEIGFPNLEVAGRQPFPHDLERRSVEDLSKPLGAAN